MNYTRRTTEITLLQWSLLITDTLGIGLIPFLTAVYHRDCLSMYYIHVWQIPSFPGCLSIVENLYMLYVGVINETSKVSYETRYKDYLIVDITMNILLKIYLFQHWPAPDSYYLFVIVFV